MENTMMPPDFDFWAQELTFLDGRTNETVVITMQVLNDFRLFGNRLAINYACQVGASIMLLLVLLLLTKAEKRKSYIFILNSGCLLLNTIRCVLLCTWVTSGWDNPYSYIFQDFSLVTPADMATQIAQRIFTALVVILILTSLCSQVWIVCVTTPPLQRNIIMGVTTSLGLAALGSRLALIYYNIKTTLAFESMGPYDDLAGISYVLQAVSIWAFSCVFVYKLGQAMLKRHRLKMPQFSPMQVVFIMGCQTMLIPGTFHATTHVLISD
jgi:pheromone alpha factor receptor